MMAVKTCLQWVKPRQAHSVWAFFSWDGGLRSSQKWRWKRQCDTLISSTLLTKRGKTVAERWALVWRHTKAREKWISRCIAACIPRRDVKALLPQRRKEVILKVMRSKPCAQCKGEAWMNLYTRRRDLTKSRQQGHTYPIRQTCYQEITLRE